LQAELNLDESEGSSVEDELDEDDDADFGEEQSSNEERETV
jgi:hypothetical protein